MVYSRSIGSARLTPVRSFRQRCLRCRRIRQTGHFPSLAQHVARVQQHMDAVGTKHTDHDRADAADDVAGVRERFRHGQDARAQTAFEEVKERFRIAERIFY